jgi:hypothetical protein
MTAFFTIVLFFASTGIIYFVIIVSGFAAGIHPVPLYYTFPAHGGKLFHVWSRGFRGGILDLSGAAMEEDIPEIPLAELLARYAPGDAVGATD